MNKHIAQALAVTTLAAAIGAGSAVAASADPISPDPNHVSRTWHGSAPVLSVAPASAAPRTWTPRPEQVWRPQRTWHPTSSTDIFRVVVAGDTLWDIAMDAYGYPAWQVIADANGIEGTTIYAGQVLRIPR